MAATRRSIEHLVMQMQGAFLDTPDLSLTVRVAKQRFGVDETTCQAILGALVEAHVLARTRQGVYIRHIPQRQARSTRRGVARQAA